MKPNLKRLLSQKVATKPETATTSEVAANAGVAAPTTEKSKELSEAEIKAAVSLDNIKKEKDGKYYYLLEDGSHKKNFAITVNGQVLYFDENGALSSTSTYSFTQETTNLVTDFTKIMLPTIQLKQALNLLMVI